MAIKSIISSGSKVEKFMGPILKVGASSTLKLSREALTMLGINVGDFAFIADGDEPNEYYIAGSKQEKVEGVKGSKLGIVGDKNEVNGETAPQLQFSHNLLGKKMYDDIAVMDVIDEPFEHQGLTFRPLTIKQTRAEADAEKAAIETAKQAKSDRAEDKAIADAASADGGSKKSKGRDAAE